VRQFILLLLLFFTCPAFAQNIESIGKGPLLKVNGGISGNVINYTSNGPQRRDPLNYFLSGNLNFSIYGWSIPFYFSYSNRNFNYLQPFNQYGLHPTYKWVSTHIGWTAMNFSPYTLGGHLFLGVGAEAAIPNTPWKVSGMYGRLQKAIDIDTLLSVNQPSYERMGYGAKVIYEKPRYSLGAIFFTASDNVNSLSSNLILSRKRDSLQIMPQENVVLSLLGNASLSRNLKINFEYAASALSKDARSESTNPEGMGNVFDPFLKYRQSTSVYYAYKAGASYTLGTSSLGLGFEQVDPGYRTLGAYFFNNDFQNITVNFAQAMFKNKVNLSGNVGIQRDDLNQQKISRMQRLVMSFNLNVTPSKRLSISTSYSNFKSYTFIKQQFDFINQITPHDIDTLRFKQVSQNVNANLNYEVFRTKDVKHFATYSFSLQNADESQQDNIVSQTQFYNMSGSYNVSNVPLSISIMLGVNASYTNVPGSLGGIWGPIAAVSKKIFKQQVQTRISASYTASRTNGVLQSSIINIRGNASYVFRKKHNLNVSLASLLREDNAKRVVNQPDGFFELTTTVGYAYNF
jgi:hypothetical protein